MCKLPVQVTAPTKTEISIIRYYAGVISLMALVQYCFIMMWDFFGFGEALASAVIPILLFSRMEEENQTELIHRNIWPWIVVFLLHVELYGVVASLAEAAIIVLFQLQENEIPELKEENQMLQRKVESFENGLQKMIDFKETDVEVAKKFGAASEQKDSGEPERNGSEEREEAEAEINEDNVEYESENDEDREGFLEDEDQFNEEDYELADEEDELSVEKDELNEETDEEGSFDFEIVDTGC